MKGDMVLRCAAVALVMCGIALILLAIAVVIVVVYSVG